MATIVIDAGHGGADPGAVFEGRQEKDDTLRLALAVGKILEENGQNVIYTRTTDVYQTPFQKATIGNEARADFFVSIHRNSSPVAGQYSGVETLVYERSGIKEEMAENINRELEETGKSKGIELTYESVIAVSENVIGSVEMKKDSVELIPVPLSHSHGLRRYYSNILNGGSVVIIDGVIFTKKFFGAIEKYHVTAIDLVPAALAALFKLSGDKLGEYADQLDYVQLGSAPIPNHDKEHLRELLPNTRLYNFYGTTESGCSCILDFNAMPDKKNCIGKPSCHAEFVFFDEQGNAIDATEETPGFLACRGTMNMKGYYHEPQLNQEIMRDDYICTKDLAYVGEDGLIYMLGRKDDVIITGGNKVAPDEIEEIAGGFEGIADCACIPVPHPLLGAEPKLFVEMENGAAFDEQGIYEYLQGKLEAYKVPKLIEQIDKIPRTYNGKLQRKKLIEAEKEKTE